MVATASIGARAIAAFQKRRRKIDTLTHLLALSGADGAGADKFDYLVTNCLRQSRQRRKDFLTPRRELMRCIASYGKSVFFLSQNYCRCWPMAGE